MVDDGLEVHGPADRFLQHVRFGMGRAESTTQAYATGVALYLVWCGQTGRDWQVAMEGLGGFMVRLRYAPGPASDGPAAPTVTSLVVRQPRRIKAVLVAVREFVKHAVAVGDAPSAGLAALYQLGDDRWFPVEARRDDGRLRVLERPRHRLSVPERQIDRAGDDEALALLKACGSARDRLILLLMGRAGLRRGEAAALRRSDVHLALESTGLGCRVRGEHVHVQPREDAPRGARAKSRHPRTVPADALLVAA
ncbi:hypothetical protein ACQP2T_56240 [Nonomuraea sp. CA-143628]|uniref:hypothetical protein n=1 Tax=Nonomuraea sp. CA-143628 TaxID=3239997 RepID=UPI003D90504F